MTQPIFIHQNISYKFSLQLNEILTDWSCVNHHNIYLTPKYLRALENCNIPHLRFVYVVIYQNQEPVGIMYFQSLKINKSFYTQDSFPQEISKKITTKMLQNICGDLLMCGNFFATGVHGFYFNKDFPFHIAPNIVKDLRKKLKKIVTPIDTSFLMYKEFWRNQHISEQQVLSNTHTAFSIDVNMVLNLRSNWNSFQDYLDSMTTKYRTRAKSVIKKTENLQIKQLSASEINQHKDIIHKLYLSVIKTANFNMVKFTNNSFYHLKKELQEDFVFTSFFIDEVMVAFSTACCTHTGLDANYVGIDYKTNQSMPLYQRVLYQFVTLAIEKRVEKLRLGRTAELMKSSLGAEPVHMDLYLKHTHKLIHTIVKPIVKKIKPAVFELRKPFKELSI